MVGGNLVHEQVGRVDSLIWFSVVKEEEKERKLSINGN